MTTAPIAAPLVTRAVPADGLTFTARSPKPRGVVIRSACPTLAERLALNGWRIDIDSRPERAAQACHQCGGEHR